VTNPPRVRRFRKAIRLFERLLSFDLKDTCGCGGVTLAQCHTLLELEELGQATVGELAGRMQLDKSTLSRTVEGVVSIGLVRRSARPGDRRVVALTLTDQGKQVCRQINASNDRLFGRVLEAVPAGEVAGILAGFDTLAGALAATLKLPEAACGAAPALSGAKPRAGGRKPLRSRPGRRSR
jgi:DNA-binding MarR family transcriptional regulator